MYCQASDGTRVHDSFCPTNIRGTKPTVLSNSCSSDCSGYPYETDGDYGGDCPTGGNGGNGGNP